MSSLRDNFITEVILAIYNHRTIYWFSCWHFLCSCTYCNYRDI